MARILVIEDDKVQQRIIRHILDGHGHDVTDAAGGWQGMCLQKEYAYDLVITDIIMPGMDGIETVRELIRLYPGLKIIAISAHKKVYLDAAKTFGAMEILAKPFTPEALIGCVENCLGPRDVQKKGPRYRTNDAMAGLLGEPALQN
ncbi:MAG: response regulator [Alphaproteobacteria bacterium]|jgi:DNA-binding NtrC family response regulator|nr:response regulator [Alphaproteobacteria bacterium]MDP6832131.1 response regulator [Alphaproteobacteria bacterium]